MDYPTHIDDSKRESTPGNQFVDMAAAPEVGDVGNGPGSLSIDTGRQSSHVDCPLGIKTLFTLDDLRLTD